MRVLELLGFLALVAFGGFAFWRGLGTKPSEGHHRDTITGASSAPYTDPHGCQSGGGHSGASP
jgi:hypothetical protein